MQCRRLLVFGLVLVAASGVACSSKKKTTATQVGTGDGGPLDAGKKNATTGTTHAKKPDSSVGKPVSTDAAADNDATCGCNYDAGKFTVNGADAGPVPAGWLCPASFWADGHCDCGCGVVDYDCSRNSCTEPGCLPVGLNGCVACFTTQFAWKECAADPNVADWKCDPSDLNNGFCDCGCGFPDPECHGDGCTTAGCWQQACTFRHAGTPAHLPDNGPPHPGWTCPVQQWAAGDGCDCGCGTSDPDCINGNDCTTNRCYSGECDHCHDSLGRTLPQCSSVLDPKYNTWTCDVWRYGSDDGCDCGCGAVDPDCIAFPGATAAGCSDFACTATTGCARCTDATSGTGTLVGCLPATGGWLCAESHYGTGDGCDCGCGIADPDCGTTGCTAQGCTDDGTCDYCHIGGTEDPNGYTPCMPAAPNTGWTCGTAADPQWKNYECDCGCGKPDPVCRILQRKGCTAPGCTTPVCQLCNDASAVRGACTGPAWSDNGLCTHAVYGADGHCDCGCGAIDADCETGKGYADPADVGQGCDVCHLGNSAAQVTGCLKWTCPHSAYKDGTTCDCGCGTVDPDCGADGCAEPGCMTASCQVCHDPFGRPAACP